jgi:hypothetical protein
MDLVRGRYRFLVGSRKEKDKAVDTRTAQVLRGAHNEMITEPMEFQIQQLILRRVHKELRKMPDKSHNISFSIQLLCDSLIEYPDHMQLEFSKDEQEKIKENLILQFQALSATLVSIIQSHPKDEYQSALAILMCELSKYRKKVGMDGAPWK